MSFVGSLFNGNNGLGFQAQSGNVISPLAGGAGTAVQGAQGTINQQQTLANALQAQNGIGNQSQVYNQLGQIASGQGPNPAQAQLAQATAATVAQTGALAAGQRGASQNTGLIARQVAQQGAATQQAAANQGATLQAQQSLNALGQQSNIAGQQVGNTIGAQQALTTASQNQAGQLIGANVAQNSANIQNAQQQNASNEGIQAIAAQGQLGLFGELTGNAGSVTSMIAHGGIVRKPYDDGGIVDYGEGNVQEAAAPATAKPGGSSSSGIGLGSLLALLNQGGVATTTHHYAAGGITDFGAGGSNFVATPISSFGRAQKQPASSSGSSPGILKQVGSGIRKGVGSMFSGDQTPQTTATMNNIQSNSPLLSGNDNSGTAPNLGVTAADQAASSAPSPFTLGSDVNTANLGAGLDSFAKGGKVPAMVSPGEKIIPASKVSAVARGQKSPLKEGVTVHGKAKVPGDSLKNDIVPKNIAEGSIVLPRSVTQSRNPGRAAHEFVEALLKKQGHKKTAVRV